MEPGPAPGTSRPPASARHTPDRAAIGRRGEQLAADHLEAMGLDVVARNWTVHSRELRGELDLIAVDRAAGLLVVCEVKTRRGDGFGGPLGAVTGRKREKIRSLTLAFVQQAGVRYRRLRFDVVAVWLADDGSHRLQHLPGAF